MYAADVDEAVNEVKPALEKILAEHGIAASKIIVNVGDPKYTKDEDLRNFNNLDVPGSVGNEKQFIILVEKGKEGWNCRSLFGVALFRSPKSKIFVLQAKFHKGKGRYVIISLFSSEILGRFQINSYLCSDFFYLL